MFDFREALLRNVAPRLKALGYEYEEALSGDAEYGFHKSLGDDIRTIIHFIRQLDDEQEDGYRFEVILYRRKTPDKASLFRKLSLGLYEGAVSSGLSKVLWEYYGLRIYPYIQHRYEPDSTGALDAALNEVTDLLERYGLPWLEDPQARTPAAPLIPDWNNFQELLLELVSPELVARGFKMTADVHQIWSPLRGKPQYHYVKKLSREINAFIIFHAWRYKVLQDLDAVPYSDLAPSPTYFDVLLFRKRSTDPYDRNWVSNEDCFEIWLSQYLRGEPDMNGPSTPPLWKCINREEIAVQLKDALDKLKQHGIPLLEDPRTKNPRLRLPNS